MTKMYKTYYRVLDDTYGRIRRFWRVADVKFQTYEEADRQGREWVATYENIDAYKVKECKA